MSTKRLLTTPKCQKCGSLAHTFDECVIRNGNVRTRANVATQSWCQRCEAVHDTGKDCAPSRSSGRGSRDV